MNRYENEFVTNRSTRNKGSVMLKLLKKAWNNPYGNFVIILVGAMVVIDVTVLLIA